jgi:hypothetical protein
MKLLMENWRQFINEEEVDEGVLSNVALGLATAFGGGGNTADMPAQPDQPETTQVAQAPSEGLSDDGNSFTASFEIGGDIQMALQQADMAAKAGLQKAKPGKNVEISSRIDVGGKLFSTATVQ